MPQFTDSQRARFQIQLQRDYEALAARGDEPTEIYQTLRQRVDYNLSDPQSALYGLPPEEQYKIYQTLNSFFQACPQYARIKPEDKVNLFIYKITLIPARDFYLYRNYNYCPTTDTLFTWLILNDLLHHSAYHGSGCCGGYSGSSSDNSEGWAVLLLVILAALAVAAAFIAMYYLFSQFLDTMERLFHNEGWLQAFITMMVTAASGCAAGLLTSYLLAAPLAALALTAGIANPAGIVILGVICLTIIGAGLGCFITNKIQNYAIKKSNPDAIDPNDPHRFTLTDSEQENLIAQGLDPEKVKTAMIALRQQIGKDEVPSLLNRVFTSAGREKQEHLDKIRQLRRGDLPGGEMEVNVTSDSGNYVLKFNLKRDPGFYLPLQQPFGEPLYPPQYPQQGLQPPFQDPYSGQQLHQPFNPLNTTVDSSHVHQPIPPSGYSVVPQTFHQDTSHLHQPGGYGGYPEPLYPQLGTSVVPPLNNGYPQQFGQEGQQFPYPTAPYEHQHDQTQSQQFTF